MLSATGDDGSFDAEVYFDPDDADRHSNTDMKQKSRIEKKTYRGDGWVRQLQTMVLYDNGALT
jgi:hypothetical protein